MLKKLNGRLLPFGWLKALRERKKIDKVRVFALGVKPEYQHTGVAAGLYKRHYDMAAATPQDGGETGWILETNMPMNRGMEAMGGKIVKTLPDLREGPVGRVVSVRRGPQRRGMASAWSRNAAIRQSQTNGREEEASGGLGRRRRHGRLRSRGFQRPARG